MHALPSSTRQEKWDKQASKINLTLSRLQIADKCSSICREHSHCEFIDLIILAHNWLRTRPASWLASMFAVCSLPSTALSTLCVTKEKPKIFLALSAGMTHNSMGSPDQYTFWLLNGRNCYLRVLPTDIFYSSSQYCTHPLPTGCPIGFIGNKKIARGPLLSLKSLPRKRGIAVTTDRQRTIITVELLYELLAWGIILIFLLPTTHPPLCNCDIHMSPPFH